ncbi:MAG: rhomboid family intramembrane serine protease [Myxococcales bacterium]|nr:rhomboid family intramembrane serine protease [Myxococcales bacterium]
MVLGLPRWVSPAVWALIGVTLTVSLVAALGDGDGAWFGHLALVPSRVWQGEVWRLVTWPFAAPGPYGLVFACVTLYWFGGALAGAWGDARFVRFVGAILGLAGVGTTILALVVPGAGDVAHLGGWALADALVVAWALQFPERPLRFYGVLSVGGALLAYGTVALTVLAAAYFGLRWVLPELIAGGATLAYMTGARPAS